jgi:hypothetical protein
VVGRVFGVLLLAAAALKAHGLGLEPVGRMGVFSTPEAQLAIIELELLLGLWLISGMYAIGSWLAAVLTFGGFAAASFYMGWVGQSSCGCLGRVAVNPWFAFVLDLVVLAVLLVGRPDLTSLRESPRGSLTAVLPIACVAAGIALLSGLLFILAYLGFGSVPAAIAHFRGERVTVRPRLVDVGAGVSGQQRTVTVEVTNWTAKPVRLIGGTSDCSCTVLDDLPVAIPPQETRAVSVHVSLSGRPGQFTRLAGFVVEDQGHQRVNFRLTGRILGSSE